MFLKYPGGNIFISSLNCFYCVQAQDDASLQLAKSIKQTVEVVGQPPETPLKLEPYISQNFMGLFISEEHSDYLKKIALQYANQVSSLGKICFIEF